jgi:GntR family transcriptional regulator
MNRESAYRVLARELRTAVLRERYPSGTRLPTEAELARRHGLSRQTVRRAFQDLVAEGVVYRVPGKGTFAAPHDGRYVRQFGSIEDLMGLSLDTELEIIDPLRRAIDLDVASRLRLPSDAVTSVLFRRLHDGSPFCVTAVHLPPPVGRLLAGTAELSEPGARSRTTVIGLLDAKLPAPIAEAEQSITVAPAPADVAGHVGTEPGHPMLRIDRLYLDTGQVPVELSISYFLPEQYSYRIRLLRSVR